MEESDFRNIEITIVGLGLIGGSYALALKKLKPKKIWGIDIDRNVIEKAEKMGVIDGGFSEGRLPLERSDLVVICIYPKLAIRFVKENMKHFKQGAVITDVVGNKKKVVTEINSFLREDLDFVGGHPLAGKERSGFTHASAEMFQGANYFLTPISRNKQESLILMGRLIKGLGCKEPICLDPEEHDKIVALTSHLPHVVAAALISSSSRFKDPENLVGGSFRDATRVARMNVDLWSELLLENKENTLTEITVFVDNITKIQEALQNEDESGLREILESANEGREKF